MYFTLTDIKICVAPMTEIFMLYSDICVSCENSDQCVLEDIRSTNVEMIY